MSTITTNWQLSATGNDANGGLFDTSSAGTDYSQQDNAQLSITDLVTTTSSTAATSASGLFTAPMVGNGINIAGRIYQISAVNSATSITLDSAVTTGASGQSAKVGGALLTPGYLAGQYALHGSLAQDVYHASGTYPITSTTSNVAGGRVTINTNGFSLKPFRWIGHTAGNRADRTSSPNCTVASGYSQTVFTSATTGNAVFINISCSLISGSQAVGAFSTSANGTTFDRCNANGFSTAFFSSNAVCEISRCYATNCTTGIQGRINAHDCVVTSCSTAGVNMNVGNGTCTRTYAISCGVGFLVTSLVLMMLDSCTAYGCSSHGYSFSASGSSQTSLVNCLSVSNGGYGYFGASSSTAFSLVNCAGGLNTSGNISTTITNVENFITLTASPFTNAAGLDFSINSAAAGGALLRAKAVPIILPGLSTPSYLDIGAGNHPDPTGGGGGVGSIFGGAVIEGVGV